MALAEETEIMREIGLGNHYTWHNGSPGCRATRIAAAGKLPGVLRAHGCPANPHLMDLVERIAYNATTSQYELTDVWVLCSDVIQAHLHRREGGGMKAFKAVAAALEEKYRPQPTGTLYGRGPGGEGIWLKYGDDGGYPQGVEHHSMPSATIRKDWGDDCYQILGDHLPTD